jgi:hypothetical protein
LIGEAPVKKTTITFARSIPQLKLHLMSGETFYILIMRILKVIY